MKKLRLEPDQLEVVSFAAQGEAEGTGTVNSLQLGYYTDTTCRPSYNVTQCLHCTQAEGCYPSMYCTGDGCVVTADAGCITANNAPC
ncbi:hypothetical protein [Longimicrobium sp.]|uniref:hypothetical protein n=1 Tax=Longimicrobium sp. TaxID=2029185 RepID=UPI002E2EE374|nr:hypothetical protein [Longimicrobium sp.]HEX6036909.1 hypothetical protein [Longimicrobium sp.]